VSSSSPVRRIDRRPAAGRRLPGPRTAVTALAGVLALQAITADGMWWDLARGREVLRGAWAPAAALGAGDVRGEADWLGGMPWFVSFAVAGPAGLMAARLVGVGVVAMCCLRGRHARRGDARSMAAAAAALVASAPALDPIGAWWDVVCGWLLVAWTAFDDDMAPSARPRDARGWSGRLLAGGTLGRVALAMAWANLGPRSLLALATTGGRRGLAPALTLAALCVTPLGPFGLLDSLWTLVPPLGLWLQEGGHPAWLAGHAIAGPAPVPIQFAAWLVLAALAAGQRPGAAKLGAWLGLQGLLVANPASLPALAPFAWWLAVGAPRAAVAAGPSRAVATRGPRVAVAGTASREADEARDADEARGPARLAALVITLVTLLAATGPWPGVPWRLGWGLAPRLEYRQLIEPLASGGPDGTAFAFDDRAAGMLVWALPDGPRPWLVPHRALIGGRFVAEATRAAELRAGWDMRQRDRHGDWAGWWVPLVARDTRLVVVSDADVATIRHLEPGVFKPLVIDAPVVPYAVAGDPRLSAAILRALADRALVENGAWTFSPPRSIQTDWSTDLWGLVAGRPDPRPLVARADVFLAMRQPRAALKIALALRQAGIADCTGRIADATMQIADAERLVLGAPAALRAAVLARLGVRPAAASALERSLADVASADAGTAREDGIMSVASAYLAAGPVAGLERLTAVGIDDPWTRAMLELEAGRPAAARVLLERLAGADEPRLAGAARDMLAKLPDREPTP
jgi:hypothetical protein